jgi:hypothetical protein
VTPFPGGAGAPTTAIIERLGFLNVVWLIGLVAACEIIRLINPFRRGRAVSTRRAHRPHRDEIGRGDAGAQEGLVPSAVAGLMIPSFIVRMASRPAIFHSLSNQALHSKREVVLVTQREPSVSQPIARRRKVQPSASRVARSLLSLPALWPPVAGSKK